MIGHRKLGQEWYNQEFPDRGFLLFSFALVCFFTFSSGSGNTWTLQTQYLTIKRDRKKTKGIS